jgi:hypothetical protein
MIIPGQFGFNYPSGFQNASSLKPLGQLKPNCPGMIIGRSSVFYADRKSKMAATTGHSINTGGIKSVPNEKYSDLIFILFFRHQ